MIWVISLLLFLTGCVSSSESIPTAVSVREYSGLIAFIGTDGNIYTVDQDGENKRVLIDQIDLAHEGGDKSWVVQQPTWSPDGDKLAFVVIKESDDGEQRASLYTVRRDGSQLVEVFTSNEQTPFYLFWSPDSQLVSFLSSSRNAQGLILQMVPFDGGDVQLLGIGQPYYWAWSPDSQAILTHTGGSARLNPDARITIQRLNEDLQQTELALKPSFFQAPAWSPDGRAWLLAAEGDDGDVNLLLTDTLGVVQDVLAPIGRSISFAWSPDGVKVAYLTESPLDDEDPSATLAIMTPDHKDDAFMVEQNPVVAFFWSPDGQKIAYIVPSLKFPPGEVTQVDLPEPVLVFQLYVLDLLSEKSSLLFEFNPTPEFLSVMQFFDQYHRSATIWSPDSQSLVISGQDQDENPGVYVISVSKEGVNRLISPGTLAFWSWK
jgi:TolB protein